MTDILDRLRTDVLWHRRRGNETIAADVDEAATVIAGLRAELAEAKKDAGRWKMVSYCSLPDCDDDTEFLIRLRHRHSNQSLAGFMAAAVDAALSVDTRAPGVG